ncbi:MAG: aminoacyl-tRNA hydrolase [Candidatus Omnitrophica bacterium]|nr:aminoacyl-tRNA hydrolase [Candidatus Omnitrophota bacterium]
MKMIVGLGNPGRRYQNTRHNIGFMVMDRIFQSVPAQQRGTWRFEHEAETSDVHWQSGKVKLVKPQTFMNLSGISVAALLRYYKLGSEECMVICDDVNLPLGSLRLRPEGSGGGHNGLASVIQHLGTENFARLRLGVGPAPEELALEDFVLQQVSPEGIRSWQDQVEDAVKACSMWLSEGIDKAMNVFNKRHTE